MTKEDLGTKKVEGGRDKKLNPASKLIQARTRRLLRDDMCYIGLKEDDQLLREGRGWLRAPGGQDRFEAARTGCLGHNTSSASHDADGAAIFTQTFLPRRRDSQFEDLPVNNEVFMIGWTLQFR